MTINVYVYVHLPDIVTPDDLKALESRLMSALSDKIAEVTKAVDDATARIQTDVADLKAQIVELEAKVAEGAASQADLDALDTLRGKLEALDPMSPTTLPET